MGLLCCYKRQCLHSLARLNRCACNGSKNQKRMEREKNQCVRPRFPKTSVRLLEKLCTFTSCCWAKWWEGRPGSSSYRIKSVINSFVPSPGPKALSPPDTSPQLQVFPSPQLLCSFRLPCVSPRPWCHLLTGLPAPVWPSSPSPLCSAQICHVTPLLKNHL